MASELAKLRVMAAATHGPRFLAKASVPETDGCWLWTACRIRGGYGHFGIGRRLVLAHRFAYELFCGSPPGPNKVLHTCDTPACVNPDHLFLGSQADNVRDMVNKGRGRQPVGETHPKAKLSSDQVSMIREAYAAGEPVTLIAKRFGHPRSTVGSIVSGRSRKHEGE